MFINVDLSKLIAFNVQHHLRIFNINIHCDFVEATALTVKHQTDFALRQLHCKQHGEHRTARYPVTVSFWETIYSSYNICSNLHFLPGVLAPVCDNSIFNCEQIELANCSCAMLQLVNSTHRKPRVQSPSIGIIMQRTLPIMGAGGISVLATLRNQIVLILMQEWTT